MMKFSSGILRVYPNRVLGVSPLVEQGEDVVMQVRLSLAWAQLRTAGDRLNCSAIAQGLRVNALTELASLLDTPAPELGN
jgi:hypothetical protein